MADFEALKPNEFARRVHEHDDVIPRFKMTEAERHAWANFPTPCIVYETDTDRYFFYGNVTVKTGKKLIFDGT